VKVVPRSVPPAVCAAPCDPDTHSQNAANRIDLRDCVALNI
jgi:hypothetical protein